MQGPATGGQRGGKKGNHKTSRGLLCEIKSDWRSALKFSASIVQNMQINRCKIMCCMIFLSEVAASNCRNKNRIYWIFLNSWQILMIFFTFLMNSPACTCSPRFSRITVLSVFWCRSEPGHWFKKTKITGWWCSDGGMRLLFSPSWSSTYRLVSAASRV